MKQRKIEDFENGSIEVNLPNSVVDPKPNFRSTADAFQSFSRRLESIAASKGLTIDQLRARAESYSFGADESFEILSLFDSTRALKASL